MKCRINENPRQYKFNYFDGSLYASTYTLVVDSGYASGDDRSSRLANEGAVTRSLADLVRRHHCGFGKIRS